MRSERSQGNGDAGADEERARRATTPSAASSFDGLRSASPSASNAARGSSRKGDTRCEVTLRRQLWRSGHRYRLHVTTLPGRPDIVFPKQRVVVFCDGDFWHGRDLNRRLAKLAHGNNPNYWTAKIAGNAERDRRVTRELEDAGWTVLRYWETDVLRRPKEIAREISRVLEDRGRARHESPNSSSPTSSGAAEAGPESASNRLASASGIHHPIIVAGTSPRVTASTS